MSDLDVQVRSMLAEAGIHEEASDELVRLLAGLDATYVDGAAPEPGPELAALLGRWGAPFARPRRPHGRRAAATGLVALGVVVSTGWAAAANELPRPAQRWVADFSQRYLPFDLPYPLPVTPTGAPGPTSEREHGSRWVDAHDARPVVERDAGGRSTLWRHDASGDDSGGDERYSGESDSESGEAETDLRDDREDATQEWAEQAEEDSESETPASTAQSTEESETDDVESSDGSQSDDGYAEPASDAAEERPDD